MGLNETGLNLIERLGIEDVVDVAERHYNIPAPLLLGLIQTESEGICTALRYEPKFRWTTYPNKWAKKMHWTEPTETALQSFSYGLMQIMLATARDVGFAKHPMQLLDPVINVAWGTLFLNRLYLRYGAWPDAISAYNQGSNRRQAFNGKKFRNQAYVDKVYKNMETFLDAANRRQT